VSEGQFNAFIMALRELPSTLSRLIARDSRLTTASISRNCRRYASTAEASRKEATEDLQDLESQSSFSANDYPAEKIKAYDPVKRAQGRKRELPPSRYDGNCWTNMRCSNKTSDINIVPQDTTEDHSILINLLQPQTLPPDSSFPVPSTTHVSNKPTNR
jgi:hypothetical protein